jgi:hypothetical protein
MAVLNPHSATTGRRRRRRRRCRCRPDDQQRRNDNRRSRWRRTGQTVRRRVHRR